MEEKVNNKMDAASLNLKDFFYKYIRFLPFFILSVSMALFGAYAYLRYATPIYSSTGSLLVKNDANQGRGGNDKFQEIFQSSRAQNIQSEIEILKAKPLMTRVVNKLGLQFGYHSKGKIKSINIYKQSPFILHAFEIADSSKSFSLKVRFVDQNRFQIDEHDRIFKFGEVFRNVNGVFQLVRSPKIGLGKDYTISWTPAASVAGTLVGALQITPKTVGTGILLISHQSMSAQMSADVINTLMQEYESYSIEDKNTNLDQMLAFIEGRLEVIGKEYDSVQRQLLNYAQLNNLIDIEKQAEEYFGISSDADKAIAEQQTLLNTADMIDDYLNENGNEFSSIIVPSALGLDDATLNTLVMGYNTRQIERKELLDGNVPAENPKVKELDGQIEKLRISILENLKNIKVLFSSNIRALKNRSGLAESQIRAMPFKMKEYAELKRQVETKRALYEILQEKREETALSRASTIANSTIIDKANASTIPVKPNRRSIQLLAILLGLGIPALFIFMAEVLNDKINTRYDIEKITAAPIIGEIGHSYSSNVLIANKTTRSMVAEQFRIVRSNLQYVLEKKDKAVLLVTSSFSGEGKSFVSTNLAAVLALADRKTIILEFDIRKPKILLGLGLNKRPGITNFLVGKGDLEQLIMPVPGHDNLFVLPCGPIPPNPAELLLGEKVDELFNYLKLNYDMVIIDTAPVGMVSDAMTLSKYSDCSLYIVRQEHTFKKQLYMIDEFYRESKLPKLSIIINDVKMKPGYGYYGSGRYGYGYGYDSSYYEEEPPKPNILRRVISQVNPFSKKRKTRV